MRITNALAKGLKVGTQVLAGGAAYGLFSLAAGWHPPATGNAKADALIGLAWSLGGASAVTALGVSVARFSTFDPRKDPRNQLPE